MGLESVNSGVWEAQEDFRKIEHSDVQTLSSLASRINVISQSECNISKHDT